MSNLVYKHTHTLRIIKYPQLIYCLSHLCAKKNEVLLKKKKKPIRRLHCDLSDIFPKNPVLTKPSWIPQFNYQCEAVIKFISSCVF